MDKESGATTDSGANSDIPDSRDDAEFWTDYFERLRTETRDPSAVRTINRLWYGLAAASFAISVISRLLQWEWQPVGVFLVLFMFLGITSVVISDALKDMAIVKQSEYRDLIRLAEWGVHEDDKRSAHDGDDAADSPGPASGQSH